MREGAAATVVGVIGVALSLVGLTISLWVLAQ